MKTDEANCFSQAIYEPYWWNTRPDFGISTPQRGSASIQDADVVIIGSGFTGVSAALELSKSGQQVIVFDQSEIGYGASTRNGGQIGSGNQKIPIHKLEAMFGLDKAKQVLNEGVKILAHLKGVVKREGIDCDLQEVGRFRGAIKAHHYESMAREMEELNKRTNVEFHMIPRSEQHAQINSDYYHGGYLLPGDGLVDPGKLHHGITVAALSKGVHFMPHTPVIKINKIGHHFVVITPRGKTTARHVILATNGYGGKTGLSTEKKIIPIGSAVIATEELSTEKIRQLMPGMRAYGNSAKVFHYFRPSPDGKRIIWGGRVGRWGDHDNGIKVDQWLAFRHLKRDMDTIFPSLKNTKIAYCWTGIIGYSFDEMPHVGIDGSGIHYGCGYSGTGVTRSIYLGSKVAEWIIDNNKPNTLFGERELPGHLFQSIAPHMVPIAERCYRLKDWCEH
jgi:glycine/D-amino acid oxidase-like deaminating enzyme